jgi:hypothetical protein
VGTTVPLPERAATQTAVRLRSLLAAVVVLSLLAACQAENPSDPWAAKAHSLQPRQRDTQHPVDPYAGNPAVRDWSVEPGR